MQQLTGKYITFELSEEQYGIKLEDVREIIGMMEITAIPKMPEFLRGVINLRGKIIPIMDLRLKFGLPEKSYTERTAIIVVEMSIGDSLKRIGLAVDTVSEVVSLEKEDIEPPPQCGLAIEMGFLTGLGKLDKGVVMLLDIATVLDEDELIEITDRGGL